MSPRQARKEDIFIYILAAAVFALIVLALYGYFSEGWDPLNRNDVLFRAATWLQVASAWRPRSAEACRSSSAGP